MNDVDIVIKCKSVIRTFIAVPIVVIGILLMCLGSWAGGSLVQRSLDDALEDVMRRKRERVDGPV